jgi:hypothetical protein
MDPNEALRLIRLTIAQMRVDESPAVKMAHAEEIVEYFEALDNWLKNDGFLPSDWESDDVKELLRDLVGDHCPSHTTFQESCSTCVAVRRSHG